ncbi:Thaumatin-like protein 1 [Salvia divinorum]|uniref:Thaumatin-like protein 1 n=1 Tax=Salvia divinorum TaxID=28513 RepID=A0ABD1HX87_SALDI
MLSTFSALYITLVFLVMIKGSLGTTFQLVNRCDYTVWPGILSNAGSSGLDTTGFELQPGTTRSTKAEPGWSGRFWGRTGCSFDPATGRGGCATGDCGSGQVECNGLGAAPPATLAEFTVGTSGSQDFYDVSLVDGYNLPMIVEAGGGSGACGSTGCVADLNRMCPDELRAGGGQGCKSACGAFGTPEYCCSGEFGTPDKCRPSAYSSIFKNACPRSYSYAYDDATSTFTCSGADYTITFCPSLTSKKSSSWSPTTNELPAPATATAGGSHSHPAEDSLATWLPTFVTGGSSHISPNPNRIIRVATTIILFAFLLL